MQADGSYEPLSPTATYTVASTDYATINGGFRALFVDCTVLQYTTTLYRDAVVQYVTDVLGGNIGQQYAEPQGRITIYEEEYNGNCRYQFPKVVLWSQSCF